MSKNTVQQEQQFDANPQGMYIPSPAYAGTDVSAIYVVPADNSYVPSVTTIPKPGLALLDFYVASSASRSASSASYAIRKRGVVAVELDYNEMNDRMA